MKHVKKSVLLWYSAREMYDLVTAVETYPSFLPWCNRADVTARHEDGVTARLSLAYMGVRQAFTTRNTQVPGQSVNVQLVDGPFSLLEGLWLFQPIGGVGGAAGAAAAKGSTAQACKIEFELRYAFASAALEGVVSPVFDKIANTFVDSFVKRAEAVYGVR
jgi:ribosome-associated toxin RatA of RatAB toxin-antitoxin module